MNYTNTYNLHSICASNPLIVIENNTFRVGPRSIELDESEAIFIENLFYLNSDRGLKPTDYFEGDAFAKLLAKLADFPIANDGGADDIVYDHNISGRDLIIEQDGAYRFNHSLAKLINDNLYILASDLYSIGHKPRGYKPSF